ncbi:MAG TPA: adenylate/guanylate cyclase domain-containing protein, partial [Gaiellaceae bacterium]|nr:adenylate/guanylate cyclase domain-containing protein [Gaiellaceae bacterium]
MSSAAAVRKTVSVLFCDLAGSTALGEQLDPESLRAVMTAWYEAMREPLERHGGTVEKFIGDAVMAVFGVPQVHEDDALRAVRAAVEMREALAGTNRALAAQGRPTLGIRIGVNTGEVVAGAGTGNGTLVTGDTVNTAKRLEEAAAGGEILIGDPTRRLVENAAVLEPTDAVEAKGKRLPVQAWRVVATIEGAAPFARRLDTPFVGRADELATLRGELAAAERDRSCRLVTVLGPAGIGKSRLASELADEVRPRATVLSARCLAYGDGITFWPLLELLQRAGGDEAVAATVSDEPDKELILARLAALTGATPVASPEETFWAVRRLLEALGRERPLVVRIEDIHWAEPMLLDLIEYVAGWSRDTPILLLCLARPELLDERPRWPGVPLGLQPLTAAESEALLDELAARPLPPEARTRITDAAEGNPLYVEQMVKLLAEDGVEPETLAVPPTIQAVLAARLDRLDRLERAMLERAAVVGKEFWRGAVMHLSEPDEHGQIGATMLQLVRKELVEPASSSFPGEDGFRFRHVLIRDVAYSGIPKTRRAELHERFAGWIERAGTGSAEYDEIHGYHLEQAYRLRGELGPPDARTVGLAARARQLLGAAGRRAYARGDAPAACNLLGRTLSLAAGTEPDADRLELQRQLAHVLWETGETERALETADAVVAEAARLGERRQQWYARLDAAGMRGFGSADALAALLETADRAVDVFTELDDNPGLAQAWRRMSIAHRVRCSYAAAQAAAERALEHARLADDRQGAARAADVLCTTLLWGPAHTDIAIVRCERIRDEASGNAPLRANALTALGGLRAMRCEFDDARALCAEAEEVYSEYGLRMSIAGLTQITGPLELLAGRPAAAEAELRRGLEQLHGTLGEGFQLGLLSVALLDQDRVDDAAEAAEGARASSSPGDVLSDVVSRGALARVEARRGRAERAVELASGAVELAARTDA